MQASGDQRELEISVLTVLEHPWDALLVFTALYEFFVVGSGIWFLLPTLLVAHY